MRKEHLVSFVIIAYNEAANIGRAVAAPGELGGHEAIIIDDGSRDNTAQIVADMAAENPRVRLIELAGNGRVSSTGPVVRAGTRAAPSGVTNEVAGSHGRES